MKRYFLALMLALFCYVHYIKAQDYSKIAMLGSWSASNVESADDDERAAYQWFTGKGGTYICVADVTDASSLSDYKAVWVILDRELNLNSAEAFANSLKSSGDPLFSTTFITALTNYYKVGGNLFLTNHAGILLKEIGRYPNYPYSLGSFNSAPASACEGTWYARVSYHRDGAAKDLSADPLYSGIAIEQVDGYKRFAYTNANPREDHNCFFNLDLPSDNYNDNVGKWNDVRTQYGAEMLAVWPHINDYCSAAIIRWIPFGIFKGKAICVCFGGWEYSEIRTGNAIEKFTINALAELAPTESGENPGEGGEEEPGENPGGDNPGEGGGETGGETGGDPVIAPADYTPTLTSFDFSNVVMIGSYSEAQMLAGNVADDDEQAAYKWFMANKGVYMSAADAKTADLSSYKAVWIAIDRVTGDLNALRSNIISTFDNEVIAKLTTYYKAGGKLLLTNHASILMKELGRYDSNPDEFGCGAGNNNGDTWYARVDFPSQDFSSDRLFAGITLSNKQFPLISGGYKEDHNCFFRLNGADGDDKWATARELYGAEMLAKWPHLGGYESAAIVRWVPMDDYRGVAITIGFGGYEWHVNNGGTNTYQINIERLTANALAELTDDEATYTPTTPEAPEEGTVLAHYDMNKVGNSITETVSGNTYEVRGSFSESMPGAVETALRTDAFSTHVEGAALPSNIGKKMTIDLWCAAETYPMGSMDTDSEGWGTIAGNGSISFHLSSRGRLQFTCNLGTVETAENYFQKYKWNHLVAAVDGEAGTITLYNNGVQIVQQSCATGSIKAGSGTMLIGKSKDSRIQFSGCLDTFNGLIDDITIQAGTGNVAIINAQTAENAANVFVEGNVRFAGNVLRPQFHAGASANWGNETHGLLYYGGKYHAFYQKNANGQYLSHMHWGHLTSDDLLTWKEEKTAVAPSIDIDWKGCWSGCVYQDDGFNDGKPTIFYTGVNAARPHIIQANPNDEDLIDWTKQTSIFDGSEPDRAMTNDYRDCFVFKHDGTYYMMIGTNKDGRGAASLHVYENGKWTKSEGDYVFAPNEETSSIGTFWEMPVLTKMGDKWLFCVSTIGAADVRALYWIGSLEGSGKSLKFVPDNNATARTVEFSGFAQDGFCLLSPSVMQKDGKTVIIGIVPDKLNDVQNTENGWSHTYSLPREWTIEGNELVQKPYAGLTALRGEALSKDNINGRMLELDATFTGSDDFGFTILGGSTEIKVSGNTLTVTYSDQKFNAYSSKTWSHTFDTRPYRLHVFVDHSIVDIFVDDKYATSTRVYPNESAGDAATVFGTTSSFNAYALNVAKLPTFGEFFTLSGESISESDNLFYRHNDGRVISYATGNPRSVSANVAGATAATVDKLPVTFKGELASFYAPVALAIPDGVEAWYATEYDNGNTIQLTKIEDGGIIPAYEGVILRKTGSDETYEFTITDGGSIDGNIFSGTVVTKQRGDQKCMVLGKKNNEFGLYNYIGDKLNGFKMYYEPNVTTNAPLVRFSFDDEANGIEYVENVKINNDNMYNLCGQQVKSLQNGIYIINGKKIIIKNRE